MKLVEPSDGVRPKNWIDSLTVTLMGIKSNPALDGVPKPKRGYNRGYKTTL